MHRVTNRLPAAALALALLSGCGGGDDNLDHYFAASPYRDAECNILDGRLTTRREVRLFTNGIDAPAFGRALQRYYRRYGLSFYSVQPVQVTDQKYALDTDEIELSRALAKDFPGVDLNDPALETKDPVLYEKLVKAVLNYMFRPVLEFARAHPAGTEVTNLVLLPHLPRPGGGSLFPPGGEVAGLAISPALIQRFQGQDIPEGAAWKNLDLPPDFTPMMFLDGTVLGKVMSADPDLVDLVAAHEFGHTGGLIHREVAHNLMFPAAKLGESKCSDSLDDDQIDSMRATLGITAKLPAPLRVKEEGPLPELRGLLPSRQLSAILHGDRTALGDLVRRLAR
jgi:hypothetical protein